jgi:Tfp pilus assembly protein PilF
MRVAPLSRVICICNEMKESVNHPPMGAGGRREIRFNPACREVHNMHSWQQVVQTGSTRLSLNNVRRGMRCAVMVSLLSALMACSTFGKKDDEAARLATQEQVNDKLASADKALKSGHTDQAVEQLDAAIKIDPASKAPWLKKAQIHFDAHQYGLAITEAQEVLQRDVNDLTAKSILAVSGLRVSASALEQLRKVNEVNGSARNEAEAVAKLIHEALGEPILMPPPAAGASDPAKAAKAGAPGNKPSAARPASAPAANRPVTGAAPASAATPSVKSTSTVAGNAGSSGGRNNPFGALQ